MKLSTTVYTYQTVQKTERERVHDTHPKLGVRSESRFLCSRYEQKLLTQ